MPAKGRRSMKMVLRTRCVVQVRRFSKVMLSVRWLWWRARLKKDAFWKGMARRAPRGMLMTQRPT